MRTLNYALLLTLGAPVILAQFPPAPSGLTIVKSKVDSKVTISFKETEICERTPGVKSYSGYVRLPTSVLADVGGYDVNSYFIYFEARHDPSNAPLAIYLAGGPGESSLYSALSSENGPCFVNINGTDTINSPWSFNNNANVLYVDQPVQSGFSYGSLVNATFDLLAGALVTPTNLTQTQLPAVNASAGYGTYPDQDFKSTANNTVQAAKTLWHFAEHWLSSFPAYRTSSNKISIWGNSWGGYWVPESAVQFSKNLKAIPAKHPLKCKALTMDAIGITNGCVDVQTAMLGYPQFAFNNTYGVKFADETMYQQAVGNYTIPGGCRDLIDQCRSLGQSKDPKFTGGIPQVNDLCTTAFLTCFTTVINPFPDLGQRDQFDVAVTAPSPCEFYLPVHQYLNKASTQQALGVPLNFTYDSNVVTFNFGLPGPLSNGFPPPGTTGDGVRQNGLPNLEYLLANNVKVAFVFGDRDYRCPWTGGEATALAARWKHQTSFNNAGYEEMQGITTPVSRGGLRAVVKQYGQFSFSRVLDAGHAVSAYAPETVYRIFDRTLRGMDVVSGTKQADHVYHTKGPRTSLGWRNKLPQNLPRTCMVNGQFQKTNPWDVIRS